MKRWLRIGVAMLVGVPVLCFVAVYASMPIIGWMRYVPLSGPMVVSFGPERSVPGYMYAAAECLILLLTGFALAEWRVWTQRVRGRWSYWAWVGSPFVVVLALVPISALTVMLWLLFTLWSP